MIVDTSALVAILFNEGEAQLFSRVIAASATRRISSPSYFECSIVASRRFDPDAYAELDALAARFKLEIVPFTLAQAELARRAHVRYGRGNHKAGLNFGDCMSYALAIDFGEPLLYKGDNFALTDVISALPPR